MVPNSDIRQAVEQLNYRVTAGDVAAHMGMKIQEVEQGLLVLASEVGGHMQVSDTGELAYLFPRGMQGILQSKYLRLRLQSWWNQVWRVMFYLIRISFGVVLILSIVLAVLAIIAIVIALNSQQSRDENRRDSGGGGGGLFFMPRFWIGSDWFYMFSPFPSPERTRRRKLERDSTQLSFLEAIFSFLFGDGDPNADLEERRWQAIATVIRNNGGVVVAEQLVPYFDDLGSGVEMEDYMLPVLARFNGRPNVSPEGGIIYNFPDLQVMASEYQATPVSAYLKESLWQFTQATSSQKLWAIGLGGFNLVAVLMLGSLLQDGTIAELGGVVGLANGLFGFLLGYAIAFVGIPLGRYFWVQRQNRSLEARNEMRQERAIALNAADDTVQAKLTYASQFASRTLVTEDNLAYTTETDLTEQEVAQSDKIDAEWRERLEGSS